MTASDERFVEHGYFLKALAWGYVKAGQHYTKSTPVQIELRKRAAASAIQKWRAGAWYINLHGGHVNDQAF